MQVVTCPIKVAALELGIEVYQPTRVRDGALQSWLASKTADVAVVFAYGRILPPDVLATPRLGCINLHASLLPKLRGAAPIQWAIVRGERETGISLMQMDEGLDTGPVFTQRAIPIDESTGGELTERLASLATTVIREDLPLVYAGAEALPQDNTLASHAPPIEKPDLVLDFRLSAVELARRVRAFAPAPGAFCYVGSKRLKVLSAREVTGSDAAANATPVGTVIAAQGELLWVLTGDGVLGITEAQLEGKRVMVARDLINGRALPQGTLLTAAPA